jgi:CheY-like chemotaxis protein
MDQVVPREAVLVVEDEPLVRMVALDALSDCGLVAYEAADADEALGVLGAHSDIGLVFTDINMPGAVDGLKLVQRIHKLWPRIELIVTSGRERLMDRQLPDHGSFLAKPYRTAQLIELVRKKMGLVPRPA